MSDTVTKTGPDVEQSEPTIHDKVQAALSNVDAEGKIVFADDVDPVFKELVMASKREKDTKSAYTKSRMELASTKAAKEALEKQITSKSPQLTAEQTAELDDLKFSDPDKWREKLNEYEDMARATATTELAKITDEASQKAISDLTLTERKEALQVFESSTGIKLTDDIMENDIPPRLQAKINSMPFTEYLEEVAKYLNKTKVVKDEEFVNEIDLGSVAGSGLETAPRKKTTHTIL